MVANFPKFLRVASLRTSNYHLAMFVYMFYRVFRVPIKIVYPREEEIGVKLENGSWTGIIGTFQRNTSDFTFNTVLVTLDRLEGLDFSFFHQYEELTFSTNRLTAKSKSFAVIEPFSVTLWLTVLAFFFIMSLLLYKFLKRKGTYLDVAMDLYGSLLQQAPDYKVKKQRKRLMFLSWLIGVFLLSRSYQGTLLSFLTIPSYEGIKTIQELREAIEKGTHVAATKLQGSVAKLLLNSSDENFRIIGDSMLKNVYPLTKRETFILQKPQNVVIAFRRVMQMFRSKYYISDDTFFNMFGAYGFRKTFCCKSQINDLIMRLFETGLYHKRIRHDLQLLYDVKFKYHPEEPIFVKPLTLHDVSAAFYILLVGYLVSLVAFIAERIHLKLAYS